MTDHTVRHCSSIGGFRELGSHPKKGASWEGFCIEQIIARLGVRDEDCSFWDSHSGAELDLLVLHGGRRHGFEIKHTGTPRITPSMESALADLKLDSVTVIHTGDRALTWNKRPLVRSLPLTQLSRLGRAAS